MKLLKNSSTIISLELLLHGAFKHQIGKISVGLKTMEKVFIPLCMGVFIYYVIKLQGRVGVSQMLMYAYDYVGMESGPQKLICFSLKVRYEKMLLISFWASHGIYILDSHVRGGNCFCLLTWWEGVQKPPKIEYIINKCSLFKMAINSLYYFSKVHIFNLSELNYELC